MSLDKPKTYTAEFRESSVKLANESDKPIAQTARDLGINEKCLLTNRRLKKNRWMVDT
jgi:transposase